MALSIPPGARLEAWAIELELRRRFVTAAGAVTVRRIVVLAVEHEGLVGWGEAAPYPGHTPGSFPEAWKRLRAGFGPHRGEPSTVTAALDEALTDLAAKAAGVPLWAHLGGAPGPVLAGAAVGLAGDAATRREVVATLHAAGYRAVKLKVDPTTAVTEIAVLRQTFPDMTFGADANGSFPTGDDPRLASWDGAGLAYLEQPLPAGDLDGLAALTHRFSTPIALDESAGDPAAIRRAVAAGAGAVINLKAGRLGTSSAAALAGEIAAAGRHVRIGGLVESGIGRSHAVALATLGPADVVGDIAASDHFFADDLVDPPWSLDAGGRLHPPAAPGIGVEVDRVRLDRLASDHFVAAS